MLLEHGRVGRDRRARARRQPLPRAELLARRPRAEAREAGDARPRADRGQARRRAGAPGRRARRDRRGMVRGRARPARRGPARPASRARFGARVRFNERLEDPLVRRQLPEPAGASTCWGANNLVAEPLRRLRGRRGGRASACASTNLLAPDRYWVTPAVARATAAWPGIDRRERFASVHGHRRPRRRRASSTCPSRSTSSAHGPRRSRARGGRMSASPSPRSRASAARSRARPRSATTRAASAPDLGAGRHRLQAALLRLGAGLPVAASCGR